MEDDDDILIEYDIVKDISFNGGITVTTAVIVDAYSFSGKRDFKKITSKSILAHRRTMNCVGWKII